MTLDDGRGNRVKKVVPPGLVSTVILAPCLEVIL